MPHNMVIWNSYQVGKCVLVKIKHYGNSKSLDIFLLLTGWAIKVGIMMASTKNVARAQCRAAGAIFKLYRVLAPFLNKQNGLL